MSGFAGFTNYIYRRENTELVLKNMTDSIMKRGVDIEAYYDDRYTHIGYRCRNVNNMENKKKAMNFDCGNNQYMVVLDGEIYNKNELIKSGGITLETGESEELILKLYNKLGEKFIEKIKGVFAFVIWNKGKHTLFLARDSFGIKPLFYTNYESNFIFASEIKAIMQFPNVQAMITEYGIASMLLKGIVPMNSKPLLKEIHELGSGEYLILKPNKMRIEKYDAAKIDGVNVPIIRLAEKNVIFTKNEIRNIVKAKDMPDRILEDAMIVKQCEKVGVGTIDVVHTVGGGTPDVTYTVGVGAHDDTQKNAKYVEGITYYANHQWSNDFEIRKQILSPNLKIDLQEFYDFQKSRWKETFDLTSIDRIATRFGYNLIIPQINFFINKESITKIFLEILQYSDAPIFDIIDRSNVLKICDAIDLDTITYLIEIDMWLEEYRVKIV